MSERTDKYKDGVCLQIMNAEELSPVPIIVGELEVKAFKEEYKQMLEDGCYIVKSAKTKLFIVSDKNPEKLAFARANYDELMEVLFTELP